MSPITSYGYENAKDIELCVDEKTKPTTDASNKNIKKSHISKTKWKVAFLLVFLSMTMVFFFFLSNSKEESLEKIEFDTFIKSFNNAEHDDIYFLNEYCLCYNHNGKIKTFLQEKYDILEKVNNYLFDKDIFKSISDNDILALNLLILDRKVDINEVNNEGFTALQLAARLGYIECAKVLIKNDCDINIKNFEGQTAVYFSYLFENYEITKLLIRLGCDLTLPSPFNRTLLHFAIIGFKEDIVIEILKRKNESDLTATTLDGYSALSLAIKLNNQSIIKLLHKAGAK